MVAETVAVAVVQEVDLVRRGPGAMRRKGRSQLGNSMPSNQTILGMKLRLEVRLMPGDVQKGDTQPHPCLLFAPTARSEHRGGSIASSARRGALHPGMRSKRGEQRATWPPTTDRRGKASSTRAMPREKNKTVMSPL